ncbi:MAG: hypothetical protein PHD61_12860, partial [Bacteroidales bacterium]|nr:hypothetical protein [Lentimicrobiaceae bacterium]MDD5696178.1 hypothetical protein [Bacteroidales bacterium]
VCFKNEKGVESRSGYALPTFHRGNPTKIGINYPIAIWHKYRGDILLAKHVRSLYLNPEGMAKWCSIDYSMNDHTFVEIHTLPHDGQN